MNALLVAMFALVFPLAHILNAWVFRFAEISPHISLVYFPAFLRLANILILGRLNGTLATLLGGMLLVWYLNDWTWMALLNNMCSAAGPLLAMYLFSLHARRAVVLTSLRDLAVLTLLYATSNAVLHHFLWSVLDPVLLRSATQVVAMIVGDFLGALLGAYIMKWLLLRYRLDKLTED